MDLDKIKNIKEVLETRLKKKMASMSIELYMQGLFHIFKDNDIVVIDINKDDIKVTCPIKKKGSKELKSLSGNLDEFIGLKLLVKFI